MSGLDLTRQSGVVPTDVVGALDITIVGVGSIGSHTAESLAKMGVRTISIYDDDHVEAHNLPNQGYGIPDLGKSKVGATAEKLLRLYGTQVEASMDRITEDSTIESGIVIAAVDSMSARKAIFEACRMSSDVQLYVDPRMGAQYGTIQLVDMNNEEEIAEYLGTLIEDADAYQAPCTEKSTIYCASGMAAFIAALICDHITSGTAPRGLTMDFARMSVAAM